jgi:adenosylcobinamide-GDP ribazoletransferase
MIRAFFSAIAFLTVIPVPEALKSRRDSAMFAGYPLAGIVIGALLSVVFFAAGLVFPPVVAAVVLIACSLLLTGAIHLDGLADCADAFYGRRDKETTLRILKDPRIGTMGGAAIGLSLLARFAAFVSLPSHLVLVCLPIAAMFSRSAVLTAMRLLPYVRGDAGILPARSSVGRGALAFAIAALVASLVLLPVATAAGLLVLALFWRLAWKKIGGCTGDVLGATIEIGEIVFLLAAAAVARHGELWGPGLLSTAASGWSWLSTAAGP